MTIIFKVKFKKWQSNKLWNKQHSWQAICSLMMKERLCFKVHQVNVTEVELNLIMETLTKM